LEPPTEDLVAEVAERVLVPLQAIGRAVWGSLASSRDELRAFFMTELQREQERLTRFLPDDDTRDTLSWVVGFLRSFYTVVVAEATSLDLAMIDESTWAKLDAAPEVKPLWRGLVALLAAGEEAREGSDPERAAHLVDVAFLKLREFRDLLGRRGLSLSAFPYETTAQRRKGLAHAAERLRAALTDDDWMTIEAARTRDLR
jgi:hypothetical protein